MIDLRFEICARGDILPKLQGIACDPALDDYRSLLVYICDALDGHIEFRVSGFGEADWPVTVSTDLPVFLEEVPNALMRAKRGDSFEIDFYEQGIQRKLTFQPQGSMFLIACYSGTEWVPCPDTLEIDQNYTSMMIEHSLMCFLEILKKVSPEVFHHPWLVAWRCGE
ncbi:MAG: hypothetical protein AAGC58_11935 [Asticcacaulis sp.]